MLSFVNKASSKHSCQEESIRLQKNSSSISILIQRRYFSPQIRPLFIQWHQICFSNELSLQIQTWILPRQSYKVNNKALIYT